MNKSYPKVVCPKCNARIGHPGPCPNCSSYTGELIQEAIDLANAVHRSQYRQGGCKPPYIVHCVGVLNKLIKWGVEDPFVLAASVLHDTLEDGEDLSSISAEIEKRFGPKILKYVEELTYLPEKQEKKDYISSFKDKSDGSLIVKIADRIYNVEDFYFICKDQKYATKYLIKAGDLFEIFYNRSLEERFEKLRENIEKDIFKAAKLVVYGS